MTTIRRTTNALGVAIGAVATVAIFAGSASAAYDETPAGSVSTTNPSEGGTLTVSGGGMAALENVAIDLLSKPVRLTVTRANGAGEYSVEVTLPSGATCDHEIRATGQTSDRVATTAITIGDVDNCTDDDDDDDDNDGDKDKDKSGGASGDNDSVLPKTGAEVAGAGVVGLALVGGGILLARHARRKNDVSA